MTINACCVDDDEQRRQCSNVTMGAMQPTGRYRRFRRHVTAPNNIFDKGWWGGEGGRGLGTSNLSATKGVDGDTGFLWMTRFTMVDT